MTVLELDPIGRLTSYAIAILSRTGTPPGKPPATPIGRLMRGESTRIQPLYGMYNVPGPSGLFVSLSLMDLGSCMWVDDCWICRVDGITGALAVIWALT